MFTARTYRQRVTSDQDDPSGPAPLWWLGVQASTALVLLMVGVTMTAAGGRLLGPVLAVGGGWWLWRCTTRL